MLKKLKDKLTLVGYLMIVSGISLFGYISFYFIHSMINNKEMTILMTNGIANISRKQFNYFNITFIFCLCALISTTLIVKGIHIIKRRNISR